MRESCELQTTGEERKAPQNVSVLQLLHGRGERPALCHFPVLFMNIFKLLVEVVDGDPCLQPETCSSCRISLCSVCVEKEMRSKPAAPPREKTAAGTSQS